MLRENNVPLRPASKCNLQVIVFTSIIIATCEVLSLLMFYMSVILDIYSKQPMLGPTQELYISELSFSRMWSPRQATHLAPGGIFYFPWTRHQHILVSLPKDTSNVGQTKLPKLRSSASWIRTQGLPCSGGGGGGLSYCSTHVL